MTGAAPSSLGIKFWKLPTDLTLILPPGTARRILKWLTKTMKIDQLESWYQDIFENCVYGNHEFDYLSSACDSDMPPSSRAKNWCFTLNNYTPEDLERINALEGSVDYLVYGKEVGATGTPHLQGFVSFRSRIRRNTCIQRVGQAHFSAAVHVVASIDYCKKDGDFVEFGSPPKSPGSRSDLDEFKAAVEAGQHNLKVLRRDFSEVFARYPKFCSDFVQDCLPKKIVEPHPLRPWQEELNRALLMEPNDRSIRFIVDFTGNTGKSWFCHYYAGIHENAQVLLPGKKADMSYVLRSDIRVLFIDAPRSKQGEFIQYDFLEDVKNGYVFCPKYESSIKYIGKVHVVVMMNENPDMTKLSNDRFNITVID